MSNPFNQQVIDAVTGHMNEDHPEDNLLIVKALGHQPAATAAVMTTMDGDAAEFEAQVDGASQVVRVPWSKPLSERGEVRVEVTRMYYEACELLGVEPRAAEQH